MRCRPGRGGVSAIHWFNETSSYRIIENVDDADGGGPDVLDVMAKRAPDEADIPARWRKTLLRTARSQDRTPIVASAPVGRPSWGPGRGR